MISLYNTLKESLLSGFDEIEASMDPKKEIEEFINNCYYHRGKIKISNKPNENGKYIVDSGSVAVKSGKKNISSLTNGMFEWGVVEKDFFCDGCTNLTSLQGTPKKVGGSFHCYNCPSLISLQGAPKEVGGDFSCYNCPSLISLEGAPKEVGEDFHCSRCTALTSLEGAPEKVKKNFICYGCSKLTSLEGVPKEVGGGFNCGGCNHQWKIEDIKARSEIKGHIFL